VSAPAPIPSASDDTALDPEVLAPGPVLEFNGWRAVQRQGGEALLCWREQHLLAQAAGVANRAQVDDLA